MYILCIGFEPEISHVQVHGYTVRSRERLILVISKYIMQKEF